MTPDEALSFPFSFGPYAGHSLGWIAKFGGVKGRTWLLRMLNTAALNPSTLEAIRSFYAAPRFADWLSKSTPGYPGPEAFWLPQGTKGCRACASPRVLSTDHVSTCAHGSPRHRHTALHCTACGWKHAHEQRIPVSCEPCDSYPLFRNLA